MIETPAEVLERPDFRRALAVGDWSTALRVVIQETNASGATIAVATGLSQPHISRLLNGRVAEPGLRTVRMICDGLGIPRSLAGLLDRDQELETNRRQVLGGALGISGLAMIGTADGDVPLDHGEAEQLLMVLSATYRRLEHRMSSRLLIGSAASHLSLLRQRQARTEGRGGRKLALMTSEAAGLTAWLYVDLDDQANARRHYRLAVREAQKTGHPLLPAYMQASYGHFAISSGHPTEGLRLVAEARQNLPRSAPAIARIWLDSIEAVALAHYKDRRALDVFDDARERLGKASNDEPVWPWLFRFDAPKLAAFRATAEAKLGRWDEAAALHKVAATTNRSDKQQAVSDVERAYVLAAPPRKQVERACAVAVSAFDAGIAYGSERVVRAVADFRASLGQVGRAAAELDDRLHSVYRDDL
ncbi:helix-turn-helix domain-containing protein [Paractinoplanes globisporus]|uniref:Helix-turn-helix domain-containing protein n=1 Tax=Paractinoplanes globisporus TaxID=113565 RepID=A0ABW6WLN4_9ACTN|nr:helix-turn-helix transcriptional regulator [Actinoplanes globisporus]